MSSEEDLVFLLVDGARYGDMEDVESAIAQNVALDSKDAAGRTALHMASANGHADVVLRLVQAGADVEFKNAEGNTALHWACYNGHELVVRILMEHGASPSVLNNASRTPVDEALDKHYEKVMECIRSFDKSNAEAEAASADEDVIAEEEAHEEAQALAEGADEA